MAAASAMRLGSRSAAVVPKLSAARVPALLMRPPLVTPPPRRPLVAAAAAAKKKSGGGNERKAPKQRPASKRVEDDDNVTLIPDGDHDSDEDDGFYNEGDDDTWFEEIGGDDDDEEDDADLAALLAGADDDDDAALADPSKRVSAEGASWGQAALEAARRVLAEEPELNGGGGGENDDAAGKNDDENAPDVSLYAFRVLGGGQRIDVRLDSRRDRYGSPTMTQIEAFARAFGNALELAIGTDAAADVAVEVSSPGAERRLELPGDLRRFAALPLRVEYYCSSSDEEGGNSSSKRSLKMAILRIMDDGEGPIVVEGEEAVEAEPRPRRGGAAAAVAEEEAAAATTSGTTTLWRLADVKANAPTKGRGLTRKQRDQRLRIPLADLVSVRIHGEF